MGILALAVPALAVTPTYPGAVNYVEGSVSVDGKPMSSSAIGSTNVPAGSILTTEEGKAEILLTPGVFLRIGANSEVRMISTGLTDTRLTVDRGVAMLEANEVHKENNIHIATPALNTAVVKHGLYRFDGDRNAVAVFDGKAEVREEDEKVDVKKGKQVIAGQPELKTEKFDRNEAKKTDELYRWSNLRSKYLSEASTVMAQRIALQPSGWYGSGWYWNPWWRTYAWLPGGNPFFSPFGYGFYSPWRPYVPVYHGPAYRYPGRGGVQRSYPQTGRPSSSGMSRPAPSGRSGGGGRR